MKARVVLLGLGLLLAGCGQGGAAVDPAAPPATTVAVTPTEASAVPPSATDGGPQLTAIMPISPDGPFPIGRTQIDDAAIPGGYDQRATRDLSGTTVNLPEQVGECDQSTAEVLAQGATSVSVALVHVQTTSGPCVASAELVTVSVTLDAPLGARTLVLSEITR